jgi:hypothetical protein
MNDLMTKLFGSSWRSTIGGILLGVPPLVQTAAMTAQISLGKWGAFAIALSMGLGSLVLGFSAKDAKVHSTAAQVDEASQPK